MLSEEQLQTYTVKYLGVTEGKIGILSRKMPLQQEVKPIKVVHPNLKSKSYHQLPQQKPKTIVVQEEKKEEEDEEEPRVRDGPMGEVVQAEVYEFRPKETRNSPKHQPQLTTLKESELSARDTVKLNGTYGD